jgi:hypothetical protein
VVSSLSGQSELNCAPKSKLIEILGVVILDYPLSAVNRFLNIYRWELKGLIQWGVVKGVVVTINKRGDQVKSLSLLYAG